ncbi:MAG TPA: ROK family protein [Anaerolineae bacterium]|nr:ROK family protein [Anaerolineae bacterium]
MSMGVCVVGIDLGATKTALGLVDSEGNIIARHRMPTNARDGPEVVADRIADYFQKLAREVPMGQRLAAAGVCSPGPLDHETGVILDPPNLTGWRNVPLREMLQMRLDVPVVLEHDAKAAAVGEFYYGAGRGEQSLVYIVVGTGIGGGIILDGQIYRGMHNSAGEMGHITIDRQGEVCSCGSRGCVETYAGGPWLARRYQRALERADAAHRLRAEEPITGELVARLAGQGDPLARRIMTEAGSALGAAIASVAMILDVELFVLGGSVAKSGDLILEPARRAVPRYSFQSVASHVRIVVSELGDDGPILGCSWLARRMV